MIVRIFVFSISSGQIVRSVSCDDKYVSEQVGEGEGVVSAVDGITDLTHYVQNGELVPFPAKPAPHHEWDWPTKSWLPNLDAARESKLQQVAVELNTRLYLPCNGFDADKVSRDRISGTIARLQRGDGLPAGWMGWRDAANEMRWETDDAATVLANLTALSRAIEDREQALLIAAWDHKRNIADLPDIDTILSYDVTANWPV